MSIVTVIPKFEGESDRATDCINWQSSKLKNGCGPVRIDGKIEAVLTRHIWSGI
ncbi:MAG: hypothetical protein WBA89_27230 [Microcoleus sp.]|uniref:hypothetical protein n=1 Tax=Microcoleus sp. TaxID=44472 RepID=UPI003C7170F4